MTAAAGLLVDAAKSNQTGGMEHEAAGARAPTAAVNARLQIYHGQLTSVLTPTASSATEQLSLFRIP